MKRHRTAAFILSKLPYGESDTSCLAFTQEFGKLRLAVLGERKIVSKLRGGLEPLSFATVEFVEGKTLRVTDSVSINRLLSVKRNLVRLRTCRAIAELIDEFTEAGEKDERIWELLQECLARLSASVSNSPLLYQYFLWRLFSVLGYEVSVSSCLFCGKEVKGEATLALGQGGLQCGACSTFRPLLSTQTIDAVRAFLRGTPGIVPRSFQGSQLHSLSQAYLSFVRASVQ